LAKKGRLKSCVTKKRRGVAVSQPIVSKKNSAAGTRGVERGRKILLSQDRQKSPKIDKKLLQKKN
jgi:hypothetical protein